MIPCLVLNADRQPTAVVSAERGLVLLLDGRAELLAQVPDRMFHSVNDEFPIPTRIVLTKWTKTGAGYYETAALNQRNLFIRDGHTCQYCGRHVMKLEYAIADPETGEPRTPEYLTRDHVLPRTRGGPDTWTNLTTACSTCNHRKDDKTPDEAGMPLLSTPYEATVFEILKKRQKRYETVT